MLKISKKADYALMALQHIAAVQFGDVTPGRVVNTKEIAEEYNIPLELLAKVLQTLAKNALIESHNGPKGGYVLARRAHQITIAQILESIEGPLGITDCSHEKDGELCMQRGNCHIRTPLLKVQDSIAQLLNNMTLQDMMGGTPLITIQSPTAQGVER
ncbi:MAG TPA: Rrf2 family transcriptional regulator [Nitrospiraceae bacterium]|nr:Rrf2 family transcriptional regulator [Nitrospiraceae bacterium]